MVIAKAGLDVLEILEARSHTHGDYQSMSACAAALAYAIRATENYYDMSADKRLSVDMIAVKLARILCGDCDEVDHWQDIAGYATLAAQGIRDKSDA